MAASDKTEKVTPKKLKDARKKGQVAKSADLNGALVLLAGLFTLAATGPSIVAHCRDAMHDILLLTADAPDVVRAVRLYGIVEGALMYAIDRAGPDEPLRPTMSARLERIR